MNKETGPVRCMRVEIFGFSKSVNRDNWRELAIACQRMTNRLWQIWLVHHSINGSADKLRKHFDAFNAWKETKQGPKPEWPCKTLEAPLTVSADPRSFYRILSSEFQGVNARTRGLLTNAWQSKVNSRKAANGNFPGWVAILFGNESLPTANRPQPIPFDHDNAKLIKIEDKYICELRIERLADGKSVVERCDLILGKRKCASARKIVDRILSGEYTWKGSNLLYDRGKWYAMLSYAMPVVKRSEVVGGKTLYVRPGTRGPWRLSVNREPSFRFGGNGTNVEYARRAIIRERNSRKTHYRWGGSNQKGHGRNRADAVWTKLSSRWKDFTKRYNHEITRQIINLAKQRGCDRIIYFQPSDRIKDSRQLSNIGNDAYSAMSWDYFQFGSMLASKCETEGIEYGKPSKAATDSVCGVRKAGKSKRNKRSEKAVAGV